jgi:hypothetical protein
MNNRIWWPVHAALGWVHTRDNDLVLRLAEAETLSFLRLDLTINTWRSSSGAPLRFDSIIEARDALYDAVVKDKVQATAVPFTRITAGSGSIEDSKPPVQIRGIDMSRLQFCEDEAGGC